MGFNSNWKVSAGGLQHLNVLREALQDRGEREHVYAIAHCASIKYNLSKAQLGGYRHKNSLNISTPLLLCASRFLERWLQMIISLSKFTWSCLLSLIIVYLVQGEQTGPGRGSGVGEAVINQ